MKDEYDFSKAKRGRPAGDKDPAMPVTIRLKMSVVKWAHEQAREMGIPYQTFLNSILIRVMNGQFVERRAKKA